VTNQIHCSRVIFAFISPNLSFNSFSFYRRSASYSPLRNPLWIWSNRKWRRSVRRPRKHENQTWRGSDDALQSYDHLKFSKVCEKCKVSRSVVNIHASYTDLVNTLRARSKIFTARCYAERGYEIACRLSVRPTVCLSVVTFRYRDQVRWNTSKIISRPNSFRLMRSLNPQHRRSGATGTRRLRYFVYFPDFEVQNLLRIAR